MSCSLCVNRECVVDRECVSGPRGADDGFGRMGLRRWGARRRRPLQGPYASRLAGVRRILMRSEHQLVLQRGRIRPNRGRIRPAQSVVAAVITECRNVASIEHRVTASGGGSRFPSWSLRDDDSMLTGCSCSLRPAAWQLWEKLRAWGRGGSARIRHGLRPAPRFPALCSECPSGCIAARGTPGRIRPGHGRIRPVRGRGCPGLVQNPW
jgi:hypothetical protein